MESYALANQKGGVGKTTVTLALAAALACRRIAALVSGLRLRVFRQRPAGGTVKPAGYHVSMRLHRIKHHRH